VERIVAASRAAIGLLTRLPIGTRIATVPGAAAFGVVGAAAGAIAAVPLFLLAGPAREPVLAAISGVAVLVLLSGAIHLDGLADTADALMAPDAGAAERARKDPAVGPGGIVAVVLILAADVAALGSIATGGRALDAAWTLIAASGLARLSPVLLVRAPRAGREPGLGAWFASNVTPLDRMLAAITAAGLIVLLAITTTNGIALAAIGGVVVGLLAGWAVVTRRGGVDGDALGASIEIAFVSILASVAVAGS
jgi:adenosylcobinamide-GDP ribazoletransferase